MSNRRGGHPIRSGGNRGPPRRSTPQVFPRGNFFIELIVELWNHYYEKSITCMLDFFSGEGSAHPQVKTSGRRQSSTDKNIDKDFYESVKSSRCPVRFAAIVIEVVFGLGHMACDSRGSNHETMRGTAGRVSRVSPRGNAPVPERRTIGRAYSPARGG